ncbi:DUF6328 family protein, partial [Massilia sp. DD77]|uniref:DUF6328 family protein n=1 Tax=Massilia sp. DD77 TaxID=3109349 RepID=UPI003000CAF6
FSPTLSVSAKQRRLRRGNRTIANAIHAHKWRCCHAATRRALLLLTPLGIPGSMFHSGFNRAHIDGGGLWAYCSAMENRQAETDNIDAEMRNIIEEARVILPGVQALFGFQTIAVFNDRFEDLATFAKICHVAGLVMVIVSVAMVMTPAIYYRTCRGHATHAMVRFASRMIRGALGPLAIGLALDMFTVIYLATTGMSARVAVSIGAAVGTLILLAGLWYVVPRKAHKMSDMNKGC